MKEKLLINPNETQQGESCMKRIDHNFIITFYICIANPLLFI